MVERHIVASSGGFVGTDRWSVVKPGGIFLRALELANVTRPRVLFVLTASGDDKGYLSMMYQAVSSLGVDVNHLALFTQPNAPVEQAIDEADVIWVGGGSVANLLSLWRLHQVDVAMEAAWNKGTVLGGVSAGSICWHAGGPTDSFGPTLVPVTNGLGLLPFGNGVHYDSEAQRRPLLHELIAQQTYSHAYATGDRAAVVYRGIDPVEVVTDTPESTANAYLVELVNGEVVETVLPAGPVTL
jgi:peptidase E